MLVVADSSPFIVLISINELHVLPALFGQVVILSQIAAELANPSRPQATRDLMAARPSWLLEISPAKVEIIPRLDLGERAAISLAAEIKADLLLIDESLGRHAALQRGLRITGTIGVMELAADANLLNLADAFDRVKKTNFWIPHDFLDQRLKLHLAKKGPPP